MSTPFDFNVNSSVQRAKCSVCSKWSSTFSWINGIVYCAEHMPIGKIEFGPTDPDGYGFKLTGNDKLKQLYGAMVQSEKDKITKPLHVEIERLADLVHQEHEARAVAESDLAACRAQLADATARAERLRAALNGIHEMAAEDLRTGLGASMTWQIEADARAALDEASGQGSAMPNEFKDAVDELKTALRKTHLWGKLWDGEFKRVDRAVERLEKLALSAAPTAAGPERGSEGK